MFENIKLSTILNLGFGLILSLMVIISFVSYNGLKNANTGFKEYRSLARDTNLAGRLQANMLLVRLYVKEFFKSGRQQSVVNYESRLEKLDSFLDLAKQEIEQAERARNVTLIDDSLALYVRQFALIIAFKQQRDILVFDQLDPSGLAMRTKLTEIMTSAFDDNDSIAAYYAGRIQEHVLLARLYANKFLNTNDLTAATRFQLEIGSEIDSVANTLQLELDDPKRKALFTSFMQERETYRRVFNQVKQLILKRNEVIESQLNSIGPTISDAAEQVKLSVKNDQDNLGPRLAENNDQAVLIIEVISVIGLLLATFLSWFIAGKIRKPIGGEPLVIMDITRRLAQGEIDIRYEGDQNTTSGILASVLSMVTALKEKTRMAEQIASGNLETELILSSDKDILGIALQSMVAQLKIRSEELKSENLAKAELLQKMEEKDWLQTNLASLIKQAQGINKPVDLAKNMIREMAIMLNAGHGAFYAYQDEDNKQLSLLGSYAFKERKHIANNFKPGEGLVGQCALEKQAIVLSQVPDDYIKISSGLGEASPLTIVVLPVLFDGKCTAVIELASFQEFTPLQRELLDQIATGLGIIINNANSRTKIESLFSESEANQVELKKQANKLQSQQDELKLANDTLQNQTEQLRASEEELKQQSEELRSSNDALEEKQTFLQRQKDEVENARSDLAIKANELAIASKYKSEFLANMSHELRTPLNSLLILSKALADNKQGNLTEKQIKSADVIYEGGTSLLEMINDILDLSKVEAGRLEVEVTELHLENLCQNVFSMFEQQAINKGLVFSTEIESGTVKTIKTDAHRLEQILRNFLSNSFKFTEQGSITLKAHNPPEGTVFDNKNCNIDNMIALSVIDTGTGISEDKIDIIFEAFHQQDGSISRRYGGTGLGLTISRELTRLLGGEIQVTSQIDKGSCFSLYLPLEIEGKTVSNQEVEVLDHTISQQSGGQLAAPKPSPKRTSNKQILIVEDDENFARQLELISNENGFDCLRASSGREALYLAMDFLPSGILLDIGLPDIDGFNVIEQLKANESTRNIRVHVISGKDLKSASLSHGAYGFSMKPVNEEDVKTALLGLIANRTQPMKKILVVEDESGERIAMDILLNNATTQLDYAVNGKQACEKLSVNHGFDCVILDLGLPDISGVEVLEKIRRLPSDQRLPVIIYTGQDLSEELQAKLHNYGDDIIIKGAESPERLMDDINLFVNSLDSDEAQSVSHDHSVLAGRKILLVDDDIRNTYALSSQLEQESINIKIADNGKRAIEILNESSDIELILMDIMMPEMDGFEAMRRIRKMPAYNKTPIIALTAKAMPEDRAACIKAGASEYMAKPINMSRLLSMLKVWLYKPA